MARFTSSLTHLSAQSPFKFVAADTSRAPSIRSSSIQFTSLLRHRRYLRSDWKSRKVGFALVACVKRTEQEEEFRACEDSERRKSRSANGTNNLEEVFHTASSLSNQEENVPGPDDGYTSSVRTVALWVCTAVLFGVGLGLKEGMGKASEFFAGYLLEQSLSVDNLFVFVLIFKYFKVPVTYQSRVLSYGIAGAVIFRLLIILLGTATLQRFEVVNLLLAAILLYSSFKLFGGEEEEDDLSDNVIVKTCQKFIPVTCGEVRV